MLRVQIYKKKTLILTQLWDRDVVMINWSHFLFDKTSPVQDLVAQEQVLQ